MARIRTIKPNHVNDKELPKITLHAHLFWVLSWCFSDDEGVIENDALLLRSQIFPRRTDIRVEQVQQWIDQLVIARFMIPFTHEGQGYLIHRTFKTHQKIDRPQPSKIPLEIIRRVIDEHSTNDQPCIVKESKGEDMEGRGEDDESKITPKQKKSIPHLFKESKIFEKKFFKSALVDTQYEAANVNYYHEIMLNWSESKQEKKNDWLATAKNWMAKDMTEGKFIDDNFKPPVHGNSKNFSKQSATGENVDTRSAFDAIDKHYAKTGNT